MLCSTPYLNNSHYISLNQTALDVPGQDIESCLVIHANKPLTSIPFLSDCVNKLFRLGLFAS